MGSAPQSLPEERQPADIFKRHQVPGHKDGVVQEVLKDFAVLGLLLLSLLLGLRFGAGAARPLLSAAHLSLGILRHLLDVDGAVGVLPDGDFVCSGKRSPTRADMKAKLGGPVGRWAEGGSRQHA